RKQRQGNDDGQENRDGRPRTCSSQIPSYPLLSEMASVVHKERGPPGGVVARSRNATGHFPTSQPGRVRKSNRIFHILLSGYSGPKDMCRNIKPLFTFDPPATDEEIREASLQFVTNTSGFTTP